MEQVTLIGAGSDQRSFTPEDPAADQATQRYSIWGQVAKYAAAEQGKYVGSDAGERDTPAGKE